MYNTISSHTDRIRDNEQEGYTYMINAGIIGATGYAGAELVRILSNHREVNVKTLCSKTYAGQKYSDVFGNMRGIADHILQKDDIEALSDEVDVIFTATPQGYLAGVLTEEVLCGAKVIDLSADYRIKDVKTYEAWYGIEHKSPQFIGEAVYGLCEKNREMIRGARLVANPGCYPTCSYLTISPAIMGGFIEPSSVIIDAKSGTTGAGRGAKTANLFCEVNDSIRPYGLPGHRHTPEIEEQLSSIAGERIVLNFSPHLIPMMRGILVTAYADLRAKADGTYPTTDEIHAFYKERYADERFVRVLEPGAYPQTRWIKGSEYTDVSVIADERTHRLIMMGAMDNMTKGAAGQAVQNMNIMFGFDEGEGLAMCPVFP